MYETHTTIVRNRPHPCESHQEATLLPRKDLRYPRSLPAGRCPTAGDLGDNRDLTSGDGSALTPTPTQQWSWGRTMDRSLCPRASGEHVPQPHQLASIVYLDVISLESPSLLCARNDAAFNNRTVDHTRV